MSKINRGKSLLKKTKKKEKIQRLNYTYLKSLDLGDEDFFVDVGAHNGVSISNSYAFIKKGWKAISIEPNPHVFKDLKKNLKGYKVKFVKKAVSDTVGKTKFYFDKTGFLASRKKGSKSNKLKGMRSTIQPKLFDEMSDNYIIVEVDTLTNILDKHKAPKNISILSVDTEGLDYEVINGLDFNKYKPKVILTEDYVGTKNKKYKLLRSKGYKHINQDGINSVWIYKK